MKAWRIIIVWPAAVQNNARPMPSLPLARTSNNPSPIGRVNGIPRWGPNTCIRSVIRAIHGAHANRPRCDVLPDGLAVILNLPWHAKRLTSLLMCCQSGKHRWVHATLGEMDQRMANNIAVDAASSARQCGFGSVQRCGGVSDRSYERGAPYAAKDFILNKC